MKNLKIRMLSLGVLSSIIISSTPVFAKTNSSTENKMVTTVSAEAKTRTALATKQSLSASWNSTPGYQIIANGGVIKYGDRGEAVKDVQHLLNGYYRGSYDGVFGDETRASVRRFQAGQGGYLNVDGIVGKKTWTYLAARQD